MAERRFVKDIAYGHLEERYECLHKYINDNKILRNYRAIEIGIREGATARFMLDNNSGLRLIGIDPYVAYQDGIDFYTQETQDELFSKVGKKLYKYDNFLLIREFSRKVAFFLPPSSFDYVFIDGDHCKDAVALDMECYWPKVRRGGVLCGHDFAMEGVNTAVWQFADERDLEIVHTGFKTDCWFIRKKREIA